MSRLLNALGLACVAVMLGMSLLVLAEAQSEPPKPPTCEEREAVVRAYAGESDRLLTYLRTRLAETEAKLQYVLKSTSTEERK